MRPVNWPSSRAGPTRVTMRALQRDCPSLSSQQSTVAPGNPIPPNVTSWMAKRTCLVVTGPRYHLNRENPRRAAPDTIQRVDKALRPFRFLAAFQAVVDGATLAETARRAESIG